MIGINEKIFFGQRLVVLKPYFIFDNVKLTYFQCIYLKESLKVLTELILDARFVISIKECICSVPKVLT